MTTLLFCGCKYMKTYCNNQIFGKKVIQIITFERKTVIALSIFL